VFGGSTRGLTRQPDYDPIARVDPITRLPANPIITRLPGLTHQHDYNPIKKKIEGKKKKKKKLKVETCENNEIDAVSGKRVTLF
jgi:hypothetical protein